MMKQFIESAAEKTALTEDDLLHLTRLVTIGELSACFAHEVTNPLMVIRGHLRLIQDHIPDDHPVRPNFDALDRASRRIEDMARRLLDFSRKKSQKTQATDPQELVQEALRFTEPYLHMESTAVDFDAGPNLPEVQVDQWQMVQALVNLFQNAVDAMSRSERRVLTVRLRTEFNELIITVSDSGHGIAPENLPKLFNPFFTTKGERGSGLGLYITRRVIEDHRGTITPQSTGRGATFVITLPL